MTALEVLAAGSFTSIQDLGRPGWAHFGVSRSGAFDRAALRLANRLVGNAEGAAALESVGPGLTLRARVELFVSVTGPPGGVALDGAAQGRNVCLRLAPGQTLRLGRAAGRSYVAVRGGIDCALVLGSRAHDQLGGIGPPPLRAGDALAVAAPGSGQLCWETVVPAARADRVRLVPGPRVDWLGPGAWSRLVAQAWTVAAASDRSGVRLQGAALPRRAGELRSEGVLPGFVQLPADGQPIVLGPDAGVTGGYPVVAVVADLDVMGQLLPGDAVRFRDG